MCMLPTDLVASWRRHASHETTIGEETTMMEVGHVSVSIARAPADVQAWLLDPANLPAWADGLGDVRRDGDRWVVETAGGTAALRFAPDNDLGVADHWVAPEGRDEIHIPVRVVPNGDGAEVTFLVFRQPGMDDDAFANDQAAIAADLATLKRVLEAAA